jgi:ethanolamine utilization protein EutN
MNLGIVIGNVWSSRSVPEISACRLLVIQPVTGGGKLSGTILVAADPQNLASSGDRVIYVTSTDAAAAFATGHAPVNASVVGLVDEIS